MPLYDTRCSCGAERVDVVAGPDEAIACLECSAPMRRLIRPSRVRMAAEAPRVGHTRRSLPAGAWDDRKGQLGSAAQAEATLYDVARESGIDKDRALDAAAEAAPQMQATAQRLHDARAAEAKALGVEP